MAIKVSTLLEHNTVLSTDTAPSLGGPLTTNNFPITNGSNPVNISGNDYPVTTGATGQVLTTNGFGQLYWSSVGSGTVTSVGLESVGTYGASLTIAASPVTSSGIITITPNLFTSTQAGMVPLSGGGTINFLRADGTWAQPAGGGSGNANNVIGGLANEILFQTAPNTTSFIPAPVTPGTFLEWNGAGFVWAAGGASGVSQIVAGTNITISPIGGTGIVTINSTSSGGLTGGALNEIPVMTGSTTNTYIPAPSTPSTYLEWNGTTFVWVPMSGSGTVTSIGLTSPNGTIAITGSPSPITSAGTFNIDLPATGVTHATYGTASSVGQFTVSSTGVLTAASNVPIAITPTQAGLGNVVNSLQVINAGGAPSIQEGSGVPSGSAATGALYIDQSAINGQTIYFYNGLSWVSISDKLNLYAEKSAPGFVPPAALANNSIALGEGSQGCQNANRNKSTRN